MIYDLGEGGEVSTKVVKIHESSLYVLCQVS